MAAGIVLAVVVTTSVARVGAAAARRARLDAIADLTALAGVTGGGRAASDVARADGVEVVSFQDRGGVVVVVVSDGAVRATAAARPARR